MPYLNHRLRGDFISALQELVLVQAIPPHQIAAATHPKKHTKRLAAKRKPTRQALERRINERLCERPVGTV